MTTAPRNIAIMQGTRSLQVAARNSANSDRFKELFFKELDILDTCTRFLSVITNSLTVSPSHARSASQSERSEAKHDASNRCYYNYDTPYFAKHA